MDERRVVPVESTHQESYEGREIAMSAVAIDLLVRALVLLAAAWFAVTLLRRRSASLRALVWTAAFAGILAMPLMALVAPALEVPVWRSWEVGSFAVAEASVVRRSLGGG